MRAVEVIVTDKDGKIIYRTGHNLDLYEEYLKRKTNDLATAWIVRFFGALFSPTAVGGTITFSFTDTGGSARTQGAKRPTGIDTIADALFNNMQSCNNRLWISYGSSSIAPSRTDYKLGNKIGEGVAGVSADEIHGTVTISASFTFTSDTTIYEVGLEWEGTVSSYNVCGRFLVDRTVFPDGITVQAGQTLTIIYRFVL